MATSIGAAPVGPSEIAASTPLYFSQLVVQTTWRCNASCAMCYQSAGPRGSDPFGHGGLSISDLEPVFAGVHDVDMLEPHFHLVGGEALIDANKAMQIIGLARKAGFKDRTLTTNGFWGRKPTKAAEICTGLVASGLTRLDVSWDRWRRPFISGKAISTCLTTAAEQGLPIKLRLLLSTEDTVESLLDDLSADAVASVDEIYSDTVAATGRATVELPSNVIPTGRNLKATCFHDLTLTVNPAGDVYPCCSGFDQTKSLQFGNIRKNSIAEIVARMDASALLRKIVFDGPASLLPILPDQGKRIVAGRSSICSLCSAVFSDPESIASLRAQFPDELWAA